MVGVCRPRNTCGDDTGLSAVVLCRCACSARAAVASVGRVLAAAAHRTPAHKLPPPSLTRLCAKLRVKT